MKRFNSLAYRAVFLSIFVFFQLSSNTPKLTIVMVIDQFAQHYIDKLGDNFNYAFKMLRNKGINYTNAHHPHGTPTTATGHTALDTGTLADKHGITLNGWWEENSGKKIRCDQDDTPSSLTFSLNGVQKYGNSAKNIMVSGLTDQFLRKSNRHKSFSLSHKSRAAIGMSGKIGHPIWFDDNSGIFTTSKAFFKKMPEWLISFNKKNDVKKRIKDKEWNLFYPEDSKYYKIEDINFHKDTDYKYSGYDESLILNDAIYTTTRDINKKPININKNDKYDGFFKSPFANKLLLDLAEDCIKNNLKKKDKMLLWVSLSPLDKLGHVYGPQSIEVIDMIYHLDKQINNFYIKMIRKFGKKNVLFVITADHGIEPLVELMKKKRIDAHRINPNELISDMNKYIFNKYKIRDLVWKFKTSQFYLHKRKLNFLPTKMKLSVMNELKDILLNKKGVKKVWTYDELSNLECKFDSYENFYKKQLYPGRSGDLICMPKRYSIFSKYLHGAGHRSAYKDNTNVPLIIYQKGKFENKTIDKKVWIPQLPVTLAKILEVGMPAESEFEPLPFD